MQQLNGLDSLLILADMPDYPLQIGALFIYNPATAASGKLDFDQVRTLLDDCIQERLPILRCRPLKLPMAVDNPYWVKDTDFDLEDHLQEVALPQPAGWPELYELVQQFHARPLDHNQALWQAQYIEGLDNLTGIPSGCIGLAIKIHHAIADGKTAVKLFSALHTLSPQADAPLIFAGDKEAPGFATPNWLSQYSRAYWHGLTAPIKLTNKLLTLTPKLLQQFRSNPQRQKHTEVPRTCFNNSPDTDRHLTHIQIPLPALQALETSSGTTINDIALTIIAGAMRNYLTDRHQLPENSLLAGMPIDSRNSEDKTLGNQFAFARIKLFTEIECPQQRLQAIHSATQQAKKENLQQGKQALSQIADNLFPGLLAWTGKRLLDIGVIEKMPPVVSTVATNVPGIQLPCYLAGAQLIDYIGLGLLAPTISLFHVISSLHSHLNISCLSSRQGVTDPQAYHQALIDSRDQLFQAFAIELSDKAREN